MERRASRCASPPTPAATRCWRARPRRLAELLRGLGRPAGGGPRLEDASPPPRTRRWRRRSSTTRWWPPTCSTPPGAAIRSTSWPRTGLGAEVDGRRRRAGRAARCSRGRWPSASARCSRSWTSCACWTRSSCRWWTCWWRWSARASSSTWPQVRDDRRRGWSERGRGARARDLGAGGRGVHDRLAAAARARSCSRSSGCRKKRRGKTGFSTDARVLQAIRAEHEIIPKIETWRELTKLKSHLPRRLPRRWWAPTAGCAPPSARPPPPPAGCRAPTPTCRTSPSAPSCGREIRACFVAEEGNRLISADYSQVELRLLAHIAGEDVLKEIFRRGEDVHTATAEQILGGKPDPGHALEGQDGQLRDRLRAVGLRPGRPAPDPAGGGAGVHRPLPRALPGGQGVHRRDDRARPPTRATWPPCSAASGASPSCARASARRACWASAWR